MLIGMLWFDNDPKKKTETKINEAIEYYQKKYNRNPNTCYLNPHTLGEEKVSIRGVLVQTSKSVLPNHFWVGVDA